jgi:hypothetical protein
MNIVETSTHYNKRSTGDCDITRGHKSQYTEFTYYQEAKLVYDYFCKLYEVNDYILLFSNNQTSRLLGRCNHKEQEITLYPEGKTVAALLHEYAHVVAHVKIQHIIKPHGPEFKAILDSMLSIWEEVKDDFIYLTIHDILAIQKERISCALYK